MVMFMKIKKYNRNAAVSKIKNVIDLEILNVRISVFCMSCKIQFAVFNNAFLQGSDNGEEYKRLIREYSDFKKKYKNMIKNRNNL